MLTTREVIKTFYNALIQRLKKHRGNWEQNDPTADDYIKNRPFYTDENNVIEIIPKQTAVFNSEGGPASAIGVAIISLPPIIKLVVGQEYDVVWDGMKYKCIAYELKGLVVIGSNFFTNNSFDDEPFLIAIDKGTFGGAYIATGDINSHVIEVTTKDIKKLDKKYLPDFARVATSGSYDDLTDTPTLATVATSGNYNDLTNKPAIYSDVVRYNVSQSLNTAQKLQARTNIGAGTSNFSGSYNDLTNKPTIYTDVVRYNSSQNLNTAQKTQARTNIWAVGYEAQTLTTDQKAQARTNIGAGTSSFSGNYNDLTNKPTFARVATSGSYNDLTNKPTKKIVKVFNDESNYKLLSNGMPIKYDAENKLIPCEGGDYFYGMVTGSVYNGVDKPYLMCSLYDAFEPTLMYYNNATELQVGNIYNFVANNQTSFRLATSDDKKYRTMRVTEIVTESSIFVVDDPVNVTIDTVETDPTLTVAGAAADAKATGDAVAQLTEQKADKSDLEKLNTPKNYIILIDQVSGIKYRIAVRDGSIVSYVHIEGITVTSAPAKTTYMAGEYFDSTGLVISTVSSDGSTVEVSEFVVDETYVNTYLTEDVTEIGISYTDESGEVYTTTVPITVTPFDPAVVLVDFEYTANDNGTYTITGWKGTYNGESSTEMIIPNNGLIIV